MVLAVATSPVSMHSIPPRKSSFRKFGSRSTRARIVSLKSRVRGIFALLLPSFVILPVSQGNGDVVVLTFFATTANQNHQAIAACLSSRDILERRTFSIVTYRLPLRFAGVSA